MTRAVKGLLLLTIFRKIHTRIIRHPAHLSWLDDDDRIDAAVPIIFGGGVGRIVQPDTIDEELVSVFAGRYIDATDPPVTLSPAVVLSLDPIVEGSVDGHGLRVCVSCQSKNRIAGGTGDWRRHLFA